MNNSRFEDASYWMGYGTFDIGAFIDWGCKVPETDETDNTITTTVNIVDPFVMVLPGTFIALMQVQNCVCVRSGTTLLHFLLSKDKTFCAPSNFQCVFPHTFNVMEKLFPLKLDRVHSPRPQDNMVIKLDSPCEDEVAFCSLVPNYAFYNYFFFSQNKEYFFEFLDFEECSPSVVNLWLKHHKKFHKKVSQYYKNKRCRRDHP